MWTYLENKNIIKNQTEMDETESHYYLILKTKQACFSLCVSPCVTVYSCLPLKSTLPVV